MNKKICKLFFNSLLFWLFLSQASCTILPSNKVQNNDSFDETQLVQQEPEHSNSLKNETIEFVPPDFDTASDLTTNNQINANDETKAIHISSNINESNNSFFLDDFTDASFSLMNNSARETFILDFVDSVESKASVIGSFNDTGTVLRLDHYRLTYENGQRPDQMDIWRMGLQESEVIPVSFDPLLFDNAECRQTEVHDGLAINRHCLIIFDTDFDDENELLAFVFLSMSESALLTDHERVRLALIDYLK